MAPWALLIIFGVWAVVLALGRYVSLASIAAAVALPPAAWLTTRDWALTAVAAVLTVLVVYRHRANIKRLLGGTERRLGRIEPPPPVGRQAARMKLTILGARAWGTALARLLQPGENQVTLWGALAEWLDEIRRTGRNERFLAGIELPDSWRYRPTCRAPSTGPRRRRGRPLAAF